VQISLKRNRKFAYNRIILSNKLNRDYANIYNGLSILAQLLQIIEHLSTDALITHNYRVMFDAFYRTI